MRGLSILFTSKIAVAFTMLLIVMVIGIAGFMTFTTHRTDIVQAGLRERLQQLQLIDSPTEEQLSQKADMEMQLEADTFVGRLLLSSYMTAITITTVGFDDVIRDYAYDFMDNSWRRAYNIWVTLFVILAYLAILYVNANFVAYLVGARLTEAMRRRSLLRSIRKLRNHCVVFGCADAGSVVVLELLRAGIPVVGVDSASAPPPELSRNRGFIYLSQDRPDEDMLSDAGVERAGGLVTMLTDASRNLYVTLSARLMNPHLRIIARATGGDSESKLALAGATASVTPSMTVGRYLVSEMVRSETVDFLERMISDSTHNCRMEQYAISEGCPSVGHALGELQPGRKTGVRIFAIMHSSGRITCNPGADHVLKARDILLFIDSPDRLAALARLLERGRRTGI